MSDPIVPPAANPQATNPQAAGTGQPYAHPQGQPYAQPYGYIYPQPTNALAIVSLVTAFFLPIVPIVTGHIAIGQIKRTGEAGRGLAIAGLVLGYIALVSIVIVLVVALVMALMFSAPLWALFSF